MNNGSYTKEISIDWGAKSGSFDMPTMHTHDCHELYFLLSGQRRYLIGPDIYDVSAGNVVLIPAKQLHRTTMRGSRGHTRYVVYFHEEYLQDFIGLVGQARFDAILTSGCIQLPGDQAQLVGELLRKMEQEQKRADPFARAAMKTSLQEILLCLLRSGTSRGQAVSANAAKIQEVTHYICQHYGTDISLADAAKLAFMEKTYFSKCFKSLTGFGFSEYLTRIRIQAAQQLLQRSDDSISEVAGKCGFSCSNYFGDVFRRCTGCSPTEYRSRYHN